MPIPSKTRYPLESFDPRLRDIWLTAIRQPVEITLANTRLAIAFQNRLQQYRAALKRERPDEARMLYRAKCSRSGNILRVQRQDSEFDDVLSQVDSQLIVRTEPAAAPVGPSTTPLPVDDGAVSPSSSSIEFSDLFADIPVYHRNEEDDHE